MTKVALVFGGRTVEHEVSLSSARSVSTGLKDAGYEVVPLAIGHDGSWLRPEDGASVLSDPQEGSLPSVRSTSSRGVGWELLGKGAADVVFPLVHGTWGEDGCLQGVCEMLDLPYVGSGVTSSAVAMDKFLCKQVLASAGVTVVPAHVFTKGELDAWEAGGRSELPFRPSFPCFVKPNVGGSSVGISRVESLDELGPALELALRFDDRALVEGAVVGRELECALLGLEELEASRIGEIVPGNTFYDYADKYLSEGAELLAPAQLPATVEDELRSLAIRAFSAIGGWGMARVDFFLPHDGRPIVSEINTIPGFTNISMYPRLWEISGRPLPALVDRLVHIAFERHRQRRHLDGGIARWREGLRTG